MATPKPNAGNLYHRVGFEQRVTANPDSPDDYGNTVDVWLEAFESRAEFIHLRGGESVMAERLTGEHFQIIRVRASTNTLSVAADWRVVDQRNGDIYNVRDVTVLEDRQWIDLLCQKGVAT